MHNWIAVAWPIAMLVAGSLIGAGLTKLRTWRASAAATAHPLESSLADVAIDVANDALALLRSNPALTPAGVAAWALQELQAKAPDAIVSVGDAAAQASLQELTRKSLLSVAQSGTIDTAANAIIAAMAPTAKTARVTPPQIAAVVAAAADAAPDIEAAIASRIPAIVEKVVERLHGGQPAQSDASSTAPAAPVAPSLVGPAAPAVA
ncbi:MAG TPA: hypothetical protein VFG62_10370 [Rhodopila sp.]|jgi:hypothetical protein|nr:hypothetical protein [Rhodopila sp.]